MVPPLFFYHLGRVALECVGRMRCWLEPNAATARRPPVAPAKPPRRPRAQAPTPFTGLTQPPPCALCEPEAAHPPGRPPAPPEPLPPTNRRPRTVDTSQHFCPHGGWRSRGGRGHLRANGPPHGGPWRQLPCPSCAGYFPEHRGTLFHGRQAAVELIVRVRVGWAEGLGMRATARVCEVAPNTGRRWLVEAAEQRRAFSRYFLCDVHVEQGQREALDAVRRDLKAGGLSEEAGRQRLERSPNWVWTAMALQRKWLLVIDGGTRLLAMAQRGGHPVGQGLAQGCVP